MKHRVKGRTFGIKSPNRKAMGNLVKALIDHERIVTTIPKAKNFQPLAEHVIHLGKTKTLTNIRRAAQLIGDRELQNPVVVTETIGEGRDKETKTKVKGHTTLQKLFNDLGPRNAKRNGGYTRIIKLARKRLGDAASQCLLELVESPFTKVEKSEKA